MVAILSLFMRRLYKSDLGSGKTILSLTTYDQVSMWWTSDVLLFELLMQNIRGVKRSGNLLMKFSKYSASFSYKFIGIYFELLYDFLLVMMIRILDYVYKKSTIKFKSSSSSNGKILFISQDPQWGPASINLDAKEKKTDRFFELLITDLNKENYETIGFYPIDLYPIRGLKIYRDKLRFAEYTYVPLNYYWDIRSWIQAKRSLKSFTNNWKFIKESREYGQLMCFNGNNLKDIINPELSLYFNILYPHLVKYIHIAKRMIQFERPDLIILINESFWWERSFLFAAKIENIPTLALQHGDIFLNDKRHSFTNDEVDLKGSYLEPFCPIPDKTLVYNEHYKNILTKYSSYPKDSVIPVGQPRYDILIQLMKSKPFIITKVKKEFCIPDGYKIILWTTPGRLSESELLKTLSSIFNTLNLLDKCFLIIKQHPSGSKHITRSIKKYMSKYHLPVFLPPKNYNTNYLLISCDMLITKGSTTAFEALVVEKPLVILNLSGEPDENHYVQEGLAKGVYQEDKLVTMIKEIFEENDRLHQGKQKLINKNNSNSYENSTQKVITEIKKLINLKGDKL